MHPSHWQQDLHCIHCCALMQDIGIGWCRDLFPAFHILPLILLLLSLAYQRRNAHSGGDLMRDGAHHFFSQIFGVYTCFHLVLCARYSNHSVPTTFSRLCRGRLWCPRTFVHRIKKCLGWYQCGHLSKFRLEPYGISSPSAFFSLLTKQDSRSFPYAASQFPMAISLYVGNFVPL